MKNLIYFFLIYFLLKSSTLLAHAGGHYHKEDGIILNSWRLRSGKVIKGNFSFSRDNKIYLEQEEGIIRPILIEDLCIQDQKLARFKIKKFSALNNIIDNQEPNNFDYYKLFPILLLVILILILIILKNNFIQYNFLKSKIGLGSISFIDSAFAAFKPSISTSWDNTYFYISSTGIPNHNMMIGITNWQQQVPITQPYNGTNAWSIPLQPVYAAVPLSTKTNLMKGAVAVAVNGIPIFNALNNRGEDSYKIGELDNWGGHCGMGDDYHYHAAPLHLSTTNGLKPIAFALDGFPVYGSKEPDGSSMMTLDTCHGHTGLNGIYHYHGTSDYPYVVGAMKGKVTLDPSTTAPQNQVIPQAFTKPVRPATSPLNGAVITDFTAVGTNGYLLTYKIGSKNGNVKYSWDVNNKYTFTLTDTAGISVTNIYQR